jgi:hypothetical protein
MKRSEMKARLVEAIHDYIWCNAADELADYLLNVLEEQGMQPPPYFKTVLTGPPAKEGVSNLVLLSRVEKCEGWEPEDEE